MCHILMEIKFAKYANKKVQSFHEVQGYRLLRYHQRHQNASYKKKKKKKKKMKKKKKINVVEKTLNMQIWFCSFFVHKTSK